MTDRLPLSGLKVLDVATWIAAPAAAVVLGDYGCDVIKVEQPGEGDPHRANHALPSLPRAATNYPWHLDSRNKRSIALDLKHPDGRAALGRLIETADILITNFPFPVRQRLKLAYEDVRDHNTRLIYASFTGYGEEGPDKDQPGFDSNAYFARSGLFDTCRYEGQPPSFSLPAQGDRAAAMGLLSAILMALYRRERTGQGMMVATSLYANGLWSNGLMAQAALLDAFIGLRPPRDRPRSAVANLYETRDGRWLQLSVVREEKNWPVFCRSIGRPALEADPRFKDTPSRRRNAAPLAALLDEVFRTRDQSEWREIFKAHNITHAPIFRVADVAQDAQAVAAKAIVATGNPEMPRTLAAPFQIAGVEPRLAGPGPELGADTDAILAEAGYSTDEIQALKSGGAAA